MHDAVECSCLPVLRHDRANKVLGGRMRVGHAQDPLSAVTMLQVKKPSHLRNLVWLLSFEQYQQADHPDDQQQRAIKILVIHRRLSRTLFSR